MAEHSVSYSTAPGNDYAEHEATYKGFLVLAKWSTISLVVLLILMAFFLV